MILYDHQRYGDMVRLYGSKPYKIAAIHGGPGDIGSLGYCARQLANKTGIGVIEPFQSKYSISELIRELHWQLNDNISGKAILVGHSWGAWLAALLAGQYPGLVEKLILVGCPPLEDKYAEEITDRRLQNLPEEDRCIFTRIKDDISCDEDMRTMQALIAKSDNWCLRGDCRQISQIIDSKMYSQVWPEAAMMRHEGKLSSAFRDIKCRIYLIHGENDPHPIAGVVTPLLDLGIDFEAHILPGCGHSPFEEEQAGERFFGIAKDIILG